MFSLRKVILLAFVSISRVAPAEEPAIKSSPQHQPITDKNIRGSIETGGMDELLFIQNFVGRRKEHLEMVKKIREMRNYEKQYKMISILAENSMNVIETSRVTLENFKVIPEGKELFKNLTMRRSLTTILENCALFGDAILQLPEIARRVMKSKKNVNSTMQWSLNFANESRYLLDKPTIDMFHLVRQELRIIPRHPNYTNPYWTSNNDRAMAREMDKKKTKKMAKERQKAKGPQMVHIEL